MSADELLEQSLACLSTESHLHNSPVATNTASSCESLANSMLCQTPDPSIVSPPATKKQGVSFADTFAPSSLESSTPTDFLAKDDNDVKASLPSNIAKEQTAADGSTLSSSHNVS
jgi:hypothetical protein